MSNVRVELWSVLRAAALELSGNAGECVVYEDHHRGLPCVVAEWALTPTNSEDTTAWARVVAGTYEGLLESVRVRLQRIHDQRAAYRVSHAPTWPCLEPVCVEAAHV